MKLSQAFAELFDWRKPRSTAAVLKELQRLGQEYDAAVPEAEREEDAEIAARRESPE